MYSLTWGPKKVSQINLSQTFEQLYNGTISFFYRIASVGWPKLMEISVGVGEELKYRSIDPICLRHAAWLQKMGMCWSGFAKCFFNELDVNDVPLVIFHMAIVHKDRNFLKQVVLLSSLTQENPSVSLVYWSPHKHIIIYKSPFIKQGSATWTSSVSSEIEEAQRNHSRAHFIIYRKWIIQWSQRTVEVSNGEVLAEVHSLMNAKNSLTSEIPKNFHPFGSQPAPTMRLFAQLDNNAFPVSASG